ncbi:MAG: hypothetical protein PHG85_02070 [Candidatus Altiarchaeota archaeon]|nr:hypothetical protein [Candidatus Altiarchaeota archaeon]
MQQHIKSLMALATAGIVMAYAAGLGFYIDNRYETSINLLERDMALYDFKGKQLSAEKNGIESVMRSLVEQLAASSENPAYTPAAIESQGQPETAEEPPVIQAVKEESKPEVVITQVNETKPDTAVETPVRVTGASGGTPSTTNSQTLTRYTRASGAPSSQEQSSGDSHKLEDSKEDEKEGPKGVEGDIEKREREGDDRDEHEDD